MPLGAEVEEAVCVCYGGVDSYDYHGLETTQCMIERRKGGESGVKWLQAYRGEKVLAGPQRRSLVARAHGSRPQSQPHP